MQFKLVNSVLICVMLASSAFARSNLKSAINQVKKAHSILRVDDDEEEKEPVVFNTTVDEKFYYYDYFLKGFKSEEKMPSSMECSETLALTLNVYNETTSSWSSNYTNEEGVVVERNTSKVEVVFNVTDWVSNSLAHSQRSCFMSSVELYMWYQYKTSLFDGFNSWFPAFLQNMLGQVMSFKQVEEKIEKAITDENKEAIYYWYGRMGYMLLDFDPIEVEDSDLDDEDAPVLFMEIAQELEKLTRNKKALKSAVDPIVKSPVLQSTRSNGWDFIYHAMNSSIGTSSPNSTICEDRWADMQMYWNHFYGSMEHDHYNTSSVQLEQTMEQVHPIATSCFYSVGEFKYIAHQYVNGTESDQLFYNLVHRLGYISDTFKLIRETPKDTDIYYKQIGNYWGHIVKLIFYSPDDYDPYDPSHDMNPYDQIIDPNAPLPSHDDNDNNDDDDIEVEE